MIENPEDWDFEHRAYVEGGHVILNFGKHKGDCIEDIDEKYLEWMLEQDFPEDLVTAVEEELEAR